MSSKTDWKLPTSGSRKWWTTGSFIPSIRLTQNNIPLEFSHHVRGTEIREHPVMADTAPTEITLEGPNPQPDRWPAVETPTPDEERQVYPGPGSDLFS